MYLDKDNQQTTLPEREDIRMKWRSSKCKGDEFRRNGTLIEQPGRKTRREVWEDVQRRDEKNKIPNRIKREEFKLAQEGRVGNENLINEHRQNRLSQHSGRAWVRKKIKKIPETRGVFRGTRKTP